MEKSLLMCDSTEGDGKGEAVMDYVLSWSLRHATKDNEKSKPKLYQYCKFMLYKLLQIKPHINQIDFIKVEVWKQWQYIDLVVEVTLLNNGVEENYALLIEDKYYSPLRYYKDEKGEWHNQLEYYKNSFVKYYTNKKDSQWQLKYALVSCFESTSSQIKMYDDAKDLDFKVFGFYDIIDENLWHKDTDSYTDSESEIFNEFWLRRW